MDWKRYITKIHAIEKEIAELPTLSVEQKNKLWYRIRLDWNYHSNAMEGNTLNIAEVRVGVVFRGFKLAGRENFSIREGLKVNFLRYNYQILTDRGEQNAKGQKRYSEEVSQEEGNALIVQVGKEVTARIQQIIQRAKEEVKNDNNNRN